jgi:hypothetical protein
VMLYSKITSSGEHACRIVILPGIGDNDIHYDQFYMQALASALPSVSGPNVDGEGAKLIW